MGAASWRALVVATCGVLATTACCSKPETVREDVMAPGFAGQMTVAGRPVTTGDALLVARDGKVVAVGAIDATGRYALTAPVGFEGGWVMARMREPTAGVRLAEVSAPPRQVDFAIPREAVLELTTDVVVPATTSFDGVELTLTPSLPDQPPVDLRLAVLALGATSGVRGGYLTERLHGTRASVVWSLLAGPWTLRAERFVDGAELQIAGPPNLIAKAVVASDGRSVPESPAGYGLDLAGPTTVRVVLEPVGADE